MANKEQKPQATRRENPEGQRVPVYCQHCHIQLGTAIDNGNGNLTRYQLNYKVLNQKCPKHPQHNNHCY